MDDNAILARINELASEEHSLFQKESDGSATEEERMKLGTLGVTLDQCWDLLRQRRARRGAGMNPNDAEVRSATVVERYES
ncbi:MAG: DUF2630 family protein [bacterium]